MKIKTIIKTILTLFLVVSSNQTYSLDREYVLKAGLVFNFARYSQLEQSLPSSIKTYSICSPSKEFIDTSQSVLANKKVSSKNLIFELIDDSTKDINKCNVIFFSDGDLFEEFKKNQKKSNQMLIGHFSDFIELGGHINFVVIGGKLRFEINPVALNDSGIKISSKVIRLGIVKQEAVK